MQRPRSNPLLEGGGIELQAEAGFEPCAQDDELLEADKAEAAPARADARTNASRPTHTGARTNASRLGFWLGVVAYAAVLAASAAQRRAAPAPAAACGACGALMIVWWLTRCVPLGVTSLLPVVLLPASGAADARLVSSAYLSDPLMLFLGSFLVAAALERHDLHARVASGLLRRFDRRGDAPRRLLLGVIVATASLSMWTSNTATAAMMAPLAATAAAGGDESLRDAVAVAVALSSSLGGLTTLVGTGPNVVLAGLVGDRVAFASWFAFAAPVGLVGNACLWAILVRRFKVPARVAGRASAAEGPPPPLSAAQRRVLGVCGAMSLCWLFRLRRFGVPGWSELLPEPGFATDGTVAMAAALALFLSDALPWAAVRDLPWESMFLLGGGVALSSGAKASGLAASIGDSVIAGASREHVVVVAALLACLLSNGVSNVATANVILPLVACIDDPLPALCAVTMACSFAFCTPIATPPNAIAFATAPTLATRTLAAVGLQLTLVCLALLAAVSAFVLPAALPGGGDDGALCASTLFR